MQSLLLMLAALAMPLVAWLSQRGQFGPDNATLSDRYPTLLVADGYAFSIWGVIFLLDLVLAIYLMRGHRESPLASGSIGATAPSAAQRCLTLTTIGFALTASWMIVFSQQWFWGALAVIWGALICLLWATMLAAHARPRGARAWLTLLPLALHAGWLSLAAFLNTAQVVVASQLLPTADQLPWTLVLWALAALLLLVANARLHTPVAHVAVLGFAASALWGLIGVFVKQRHHELAGAGTSAWIALALAAVLLAQTIWLRRRARDDRGRDDRVMSYRHG